MLTNKGKENISQSYPVFVCNCLKLLDLFCSSEPAAPRIENDRFWYSPGDPRKLG
jgi:hypothetical protein